MKFKTALSVAMFLSLPLFASAATHMCVQGTLASYIALGASGCTVANATFANFSLAPATTTGIPASKIIVTPPMPIVPSPSLAFSAPWQAAAAGSQQSTIKYTVSFSPPLGSSPANGIQKLVLGTAKVSGIIGAAEVDETITEGTLSALLSVYEKCDDACTIKSSEQITLLPVTTLQITDAVTITGGNAGASLSGFTVYFDDCSMCAEPQ
jgi:hypothetical protein